jgi:hypothetical protein
MFCTNCATELSDGKFCHNCGKEKSLTSKIDLDKDGSLIEKPITHNSVAQVNEKNIKIALFWLIGPFVSLIVVLMLYAISTFIFAEMGLTNIDAEDSSLIPVLFQWLFSLLGVVAVILLIVGIPIGIIFLAKREVDLHKNYDSRSGQGSNSEVPTELRKWNWGAAGLTWIWGASNRVWISFLVFIPFVNFFFWIYLGLNGNRLAWQKNKWTSPDDFLKTQARWKPWGVAFFIIHILYIFLYSIGLGLSGE